MKTDSKAILDHLNPEQEKAVTHPDGPLLVLAGAGSGKTRILTRRIAHLISRGIPAFNILGVTFTNKAAEQMRYRVGQLVQHEVWISTFHSTCLKVLRIDGLNIGLKTNFSIYDDHDQLVLLHQQQLHQSYPAQNLVGKRLQSQHHQSLGVVRPQSRTLEHGTTGTRSQ